MQVQVAGPAYADRAVLNRFFEQALDAVKQVPGVERAALTGQLPLSGDSDVYGVQFEADGADAPASGGAFRYAVSPGYFETMGIPLLRGRGITAPGSRVGAAGRGDQRIARAPALCRRRSDRTAPAHRPNRPALVHGGRRGRRRQAVVARDRPGSTPSTWRRRNGISRIARCRS